MKVTNMKNKMDLAVVGVKEQARKLLTRKHEGLEGVLVTVGLCIIALLLCVVMKDSISTFITTLVGNLTTRAQGILGV
uniref:hypothetical protein n=1 Tax=Acetatifactor sp. TaxID=1872090 RepID=UPI004057023C